ncbi:MAG: helix-turn-helix domain-containing protein [Clostridia bacterium]|nr:helix-turn-helix domain-containing protein [Clostridia bacterium]
MISKRLTLLRKELGLTQEELANKLQITRSSLSLYELGKRAG